MLHLYGTVILLHSEIIETSTAPLMPHQLAASFGKASIWHPMGRCLRVMLQLGWINHSRFIFTILAYCLLKCSETLLSQMILIICLIMNLRQTELDATSTLCLEIGDGNRQYVLILGGIYFLTFCTHRIWLHCRILTQPVQCLFRLSWEVIKWQFLSQPVRTITGHCMHQLEMSTTIYSEPMEMALSS